MSDKNQDWHLDRRIPLGLLFILITQLVVSAMWAATTDTRVGALEREDQELEEDISEDLEKIETKIDRIDDKLDSVIMKYGDERGSK